MMLLTEQGSQPYSQQQRMQRMRAGQTRHQRWPGSLRRQSAEESSADVASRLLVCRCAPSRPGRRMRPPGAAGEPPRSCLREKKIHQWSRLGRLRRTEWPSSQAWQFWIDRDGGGILNRRGRAEAHQETSCRRPCSPRRTSQ
jgi:hypothetical protein